jgi:hypothetical protein
VLRLLKRFEALTAVGILANYESGFRFSFLFPRYLKRLAPNSRLAQHFYDSVWFVITLL